MYFSRGPFSPSWLQKKCLLGENGPLEKYINDIRLHFNNICPLIISPTLLLGAHPARNRAISSTASALHHSVEHWRLTCSPHLQVQGAQKSTEIIAPMVS